MTSPATETTFARIVCVTAPRCATCGTTPDYDEGEIHYPDTHAARASLLRDYQWTPILTPDQPSPDSADHWLCAQCACATVGHTTVIRPGWFDKATGIQYHPWQHCERCGATITYPDPTPAPPGYPRRRAAGYHGPSWDANVLPEGGPLAEAFHTLIHQANGLFRLARLNAYLADHSEMVIPDDGCPPPDVATAVTAADQLITLTTRLRNRLIESAKEAA